MSIEILRLYRSKGHPEMEPFPTLKRSWGEPESRVLRKIRSLEDEAYRKRGYQLEETTRAYPEVTVGYPVDEWPEELRAIWQGYEDDLDRIDKEIDHCYETIESIESELYSGLDPLEFRQLEFLVEYEITRRNRLKQLPCWGLENLLTKDQREFIRENSYFYHNGGVSNKWGPFPDLPAELIGVRIIGEKGIQEIVNRFVEKGTLWVENQERLLLGLELATEY